MLEAVRHISYKNWDQFHGQANHCMKGNANS